MMLNPVLVPTSYSVDQAVYKHPSQELRFIGSKPYNPRYHAFKDFERYGDVFHLFAQVLGQNPPSRVASSSKFKEEKGVRHAQLNGVARHVQSVNPLQYNIGEFTDSVYGFDIGFISGIESPWADGVSYGASSILASGPSTGIPFILGDFDRPIPYTNVGYLADLVEYWTTSEFKKYYQAGSNSYYFTTRYSDINFTLHPYTVNAPNEQRNLLLEITYTHKVLQAKYASATFEDPTHSSDLVAECESSIRVYQNTFDGPPLSIRDKTEVNFGSTVTRFERVGGGTPLSAWPHPPYDYDVELPFIYASTPSPQPTPEMGISQINDVRRFVKDPSPFYQGGEPQNSLLTSFVDAVHKDFGHIRPMAIKSYRDAIENYEQIIGTNHLETLSELHSLCSIIPELPRFASLVSRLRRGDFIGFTTEVLDNLTSGHLAVSFGLLPTVDSLEEAVSLAGRVRDRIMNLDQKGTYYGRFDYPFPPGTFGVETSAVAVRSKVVIKESSSSLANTLLASAALGVQPNSSNWWDTVPFSFAVDAYLGIGDRLGNIDSWLKAFVYEIEYCVHSYTIISVIPQEHVSSYNLDSTDGISAKYFVREASAYPVSIKGSKFDFDLPSRGLQPSIVGSLVWQQTR
jgi:hypothetical protein